MAPGFSISLTVNFMDMTKNTILITGGGSGIGRALAEEFHKLGNQVVISGRRQEKLDDVTVANRGMKALVVDIADADSVAAFADKVTAQFPALNAVFHVAGQMKPEDVKKPGPATIAEDIIATNLLGPIRLTAALLPTLLKQPAATIMTVSSGLAFVPMAMTPTYCATKAAIHSYTESLRYQLRDTSVKVVELIPPYVRTTLMGDHQAADPRAMPLDEYIAEVMSMMASHPDAPEINVERVLPLRLAGDGGREKYNAFFQSFNEQPSGH